MPWSGQQYSSSLHPWMLCAKISLNCPRFFKKVLILKCCWCCFFYHFTDISPWRRMSAALIWASLFTKGSFVSSLFKFGMWVWRRSCQVIQFKIIDHHYKYNPSYHYYIGDFQSVILNLRKSKGDFFQYLSCFV